MGLFARRFFSHSKRYTQPFPVILSLAFLFGFRRIRAQRAALVTQSNFKNCGAYAPGSLVGRSSGLARDDERCMCGADAAQKSAKKPSGCKNATPDSRKYRFPVDYSRFNLCPSLLITIAYEPTARPETHNIASQTVTCANATPSICPTTNASCI